MSAAATAARLRPRDRAPRLVSLIVPVFNEEESIGLFLAAIERALPARDHALEIVFVDDGSADGTLAVLQAASARDPRIVVIELSRNFGKEAAMSAGLDFARGEVVVPIDVDLQDPPELIPAMVACWREGFDVVLGVRAERGEGRLKTTTAAWFYRAFNLVSPMKLPPDAGDFRLMDAAVVAALRRLPERSRFMKGLFAWAGFPTTALGYTRPGRAAGRTKWNYRKLWNFALDGMVNFSTAPLKAWSYLGAGVALFAMLYAATIILQHLHYGTDVPGYASLMVVVLLLGAMQLFSIGILGEYLARNFIESKQRPVYLIRSIQRGAAEPAAAPAETASADAG